MDYDWLLLSLFVIINIIAAFTNHIDDTDETYGYWEPLHYFLYGRGMQTWEYSTDYAIRPYSYLVPFYFFGESLKMLLTGLSKSAIFYGIRCVLGLFNARIEYQFIKQISYTFGNSISRYLTILLLFSPGVLYVSTSLLPSALCSAYIMLTIISWLQDKYAVAIVFGSIGVLGCGWPFVGLLLLPIGIHMLTTVYSNRKAVTDIIAFIMIGIIIASIISIPTIIIDSFFYGKM